MYVIYPAEQVVSLTYSEPAAPRVRPRPTLDALPPLLLPTPPAPRSPSTPAPPPSDTTAPPERPERAPASPTPSLDKPKLRDRAKNKLLKKLGRTEDSTFGKITRAPALDDFELPAPLPTPAFSRENIYGRDFDALFANAETPHFDKNVRVVTPELERRSDVSAPHFPSTCSLAASPVPRPHSAPFPSAPSQSPSPSPQRSSFEGSISGSKSKKVSFFRKWSRARAGSSGSGGLAESRGGGMAAPPIEHALRDLVHPAHFEHLKNHSNVTFKLVKTVSDFTSQLAHMYEQHSSELQLLVSNFRKKNSELRKERESSQSSLFLTWETLLQEVEADVVGYSGAAASLERQVARPLLDKTFHMKLQARKLFSHKDGCEAILAKADEQLNKSRQEYRAAFLLYSASPNPTALAAYYDCHNNYVQQLTATNAMLEQYNKYTLPTILQELEEIFTDATSAVSDAIFASSEILAGKCTEQHRRYESLCAQARVVSAGADLAHLARALRTLQQPSASARRVFVPPYPPAPDDPPTDVPPETMPPILRHEMIMDRVGATQAKMSFDQLWKDQSSLEMQIKQLQEHLDSLARIQSRSLEGNLFNKVSELQEEISLKKYDYRAAQLHLAAVRAQKELFAAKAESASGNPPDRKLSSSSAGSMKNKWLKAFRSLKPPTTMPPPQPVYEKRNGAARDATRMDMADADAHNFQENTYKKITPCDVCSQVLRGHTRQGLRCKLCKMNVHSDCIGKVGKCQTKSKLLRRQKSTSEIEARIDMAYDDDRLQDGWLPGQRLCRLTFNDSVEFDGQCDQFYEESEETTTRPFGQPLCITNENGSDPPPSILKSTNSVRKKK